MTREEAIEVLKRFRKVIGLNDDLKRALDKRDIPLLDMAIEALHCEEAEEKGYCHRIIPSNVEVVVRCKDCRFAMVRTKEEMNKPIKPQPILCEWLCIGVENDAYCSHGERREP